MSPAYVVGDVTSHLLVRFVVSVALSGQQTLVELHASRM